MTAVERTERGLYPAEGSIDALLAGCGADQKKYREFLQWLKKSTGVSVVSESAFWSFVHPLIPETLVVYLGLGSIIAQDGLGRHGKLGFEMARGYFGSLQSRGAPYAFYNWGGTFNGDGICSADCFVRLYGEGVNVGVNVKLKYDGK